MIIFASDTPEYTVPTNALLINKALGATNANAIFDINNNCTSMVVALDNATHFMKAHKDVKKAIVVGSFHASAMVRFDDTVTYPNFGDASTALLLEKTEDEETRGYIDSRYKSDSSYADCVKFPACGHAEALLGKQHKYYRRLEWNPFDSSFFLRCICGSNYIFNERTILIIPHNLVIRVTKTMRWRNM